MTNETSLQRFVDAQSSDYERALAEIKNGKKRSHWMWYIFPQLQGLGFSDVSRYYALKDLAEAADYFRHPVLGSRLLGICQELLKLGSNDANQVFGSPDNLKLKSSMTLFAALPDADPVFQAVLAKFFTGVRDGKTLQLLGKQP